jgi:uncharacterized membrane protein YphA (DoxX/SURF4 family)
MPSEWIPLAAGMAALAVRVLLGLIFLQAGVQKARHLAEFNGVVLNYRILPRRLAPVVSALLPAVEIGVAVALFAGVTPWAEAAAAVLLGVFAWAMAVNVKRGRRDIDCGCFQSTLRQVIGWSTVVRNLGLIALVGAAAAAPAQSLPIAGVAQALAAGLVLFVLYGALNTLDAVRAPRTAFSDLQDA